MSAHRARPNRQLLITIVIPVIPNLGFRFVEQAKAKKKKSLCVFVSGTLNFLHLFQKILKQQRILIIYQKRCQTGVMA